MAPGNRRIASAGPAILLIVLLSGCTAPRGLPVAGGAPGTPSSPEVSCKARAAQFAVGKVATASVVEQARQRSGALMARTLRPNQVVTMEFSGDRLNLDLDAASVVTRVRCG